MVKKGYNILKSDKKGDFMRWNKRIKDLREDHDMTQDELADKLGVSKRTLLRYESGTSEPTISILISLSLLFNVSIDYIVGIKDSTVIDEENVKDQLDYLINYIEKIKSNI